MLPAEFCRLPIAHRALHNRADGRPENSRAAIRAAIAAGYGIEIDLQPSADGVPMVFHDEELMRLTGTAGRITDLPAAKLRMLRLIGGDEGIPTFAEVLEIVAGQVPLLVEIKDQDGALGPKVGALEAAVAAALVGYQGPVALMSFNPHSVAALAELAPEIPRGLTTEAFVSNEWPITDPAIRAHLAEIADYDRVGASFISHHAADLARPRVAELKAAGARILCWTIRSAEAEAQARTVAENITFEGYLAAHPA
jgi:glycerophosphoryl diester phosphodiesterase